jgi:hypothetical protein
LKYSGQVGRSAGAKSFEEEMVRLAVMAHVRHRETNYWILSHPQMAQITLI